MAVERTLSIIKPDAVASNVIGEIYARFEKAGLKIVAAKMAHLSRSDAEGFYAVHKGRPFFNSLVSFMTSGPCMPLVLEKTDAVAALRAGIGTTDPADAAPGTVRKLFAESKERNAIHASDSEENALREAGFFFANTEILRAR